MAPHQKTQKWVGAATGQHTNTLALKKPLFHWLSNLLLNQKFVGGVLIIY